MLSAVWIEHICNKKAGKRKSELFVGESNHVFFAARPLYVPDRLYGCMDRASGNKGCWCPQTDIVLSLFGGVVSVGAGDLKCRS